MGILSDLALRRIHSGKSARAFQFEIGGVPYSSSVRSLGADFDCENGGSALTIDVRENLEGLEDAAVVLRLGYGTRTVPYFVGTLQEPQSLAEGKAVCHGPFKLMAGQSFGERATYQGVTLDFFFRDLGRRAGYGNGVVNVSGGDAYTVEKLDFTEETTLGEAAKSGADPANFVFFDAQNGKRFAMPRPKPGATARAKAHYQEHNYLTLDLKETREGRFSKVVVFRRNSDGSYAVRQEAPVPQGSTNKTKAPANRIFYVPEFPGNAVAARKEAYEEAKRLAGGLREGTLSGAWINPELGPWDSITAEKTEYRPKRDPNGAAQKRGKFLVVYRITISKSLSLAVDAATHHMSLDVEGSKLSETKLRDPITLPARLLSPGIVPAPPIPGLKPDVGLKPSKSTGGLKPDVGRKPDVGLKPRRSFGGLKPDSTHFQVA